VTGSADGLSTDEWCDALAASMTERVIGGVEFPHFADDEVQERTHGSTGAMAMREAALFYKFIASKEFFPAKHNPVQIFSISGPAGAGSAGSFCAISISIGSMALSHGGRAPFARARSIRIFAS
jgi:hypothetical protein